MDKKFLQVVDSVHMRMTRRLAEMSGEKEELIEDLATITALRDMVRSTIPESSPEPPKVRRPVQRRRRKPEPPDDQPDPEGSPGQDKTV
jgi:hypothetical protein